MKRHELRLELLKQMPLKTGEVSDVIERCRQLEAYCYEGDEPGQSDENPFASSPSKSETTDNPSGAGQTRGKDREKSGPASRR